MQYAISKPSPRPISFHIFLRFQSFFLPPSRKNVKNHKPAKAFGERVAGGGCGRAVKNNKSISSPAAQPPRCSIYYTHIIAYITSYIPIYIYISPIYFILYYYTLSPRRRWHIAVVYYNINTWKKKIVILILLWFITALMHL